MVLHDVTTCGRQGSVRTSPSGRRGTSRGAGGRLIGPRSACRSLSFCGRRGRGPSAPCSMAP